MKIWQLCFDVNNYANLQAIPPLTADEIQSFNGSKKLADWSPRRVEPIETDLELGDAPGFTIPVFSQKACDVLVHFTNQFHIRKALIDAPSPRNTRLNNTHPSENTDALMSE